MRNQILRRVIFLIALILGLIKENEIPEKWGLLYLNDKNKIEIIKVAEIQRANMIAECNILISLIRRQS